MESENSNVAFRQMEFIFETTRSTTSSSLALELQDGACAGKSFEGSRCMDATSTPASVPDSFVDLMNPPPSPTRAETSASAHRTER
jgi:hypothetical protein